VGFEPSTGVTLRSIIAGMEAAAPAIVGRDDELSLAAAFLKVPTDLPGALLLEGEAGIGKSTVWRHAVDLARANGFRVLETRPSESETALSFAGLGDLLAEAVGDLIPALPRPQARALEVALLLREPGVTPPDPRGIATAFLGALRELARHQPLLVAVDDLQWLDPPSLAVIEYAARRLRDEPIGLLLTRRLVGDDEPLALERALETDLRRVTLGPLSLGSLHRLLRDRLEVTISRPLLRRIHELSGGNPFFALELARAQLSEPGSQLPERLGTLVRDRLEALPATTRYALAVAAALAQPTAELVDSVVEGGVAALAASEHAHVIELESGRIHFAHPLLASGAYLGVDAPTRRTIHSRLAELVQDPEEGARHLALAATGPDAHVARALSAAADHAHARGAPAASAELLERAAELTPADDPAAARRRLADAAYYHFESGDSRRARVLLETLLGHAAPGPERARLLTRLARVRAYDDDLWAPIDLGLQAISEAGPDKVTRAEAHEGVAGGFFKLRERLAEAVYHAESAVALAREVGNEALLAEALGTQLLSEAILGRQAAAATLEEVIAHQSVCEHLRLLAQPKFQCGVVWMWQEEVERARTAFRELIDRGRQIGDEGSLPYLLVLLAQADCLAGEFESARRHAEEGYELAEQAGQRSLEAYLLAVRALVDAHAGRTGVAREAGEHALALADSMSARPAQMFAAAALGLLELSLEQPAATVERLRPLLEFVQKERIADPCWTRFAIDLVEALIEDAQIDEAESLLTWYEGNAVRLGRSAAIAQSLRCRGLLAAASGDLDGSHAAFERALAEHERSCLPFDRARTLLAYGGAKRRAKRKAPAREMLELTLAEFERLGAKLYAERTREELSRISGRSPSGGVLTPTEQRIAQLVAEGRSNKEVAAAMFVTAKTVETNLSRIYAKLGIHSRTELARRIAEGVPAPKL
jgi:DNA-binding CsgD family transcriptional regulator